MLGPISRVLIEHLTLCARTLTELARDRMDGVAGVARVRGFREHR
jgi:hypothetical protein